VPALDGAPGGALLQTAIMPLRFEWDRAKAAANLRRHGVSFREAATIFADPLASTLLDPRHSETEDRLVTFGLSHRRRLLAVMFTERELRQEDGSLTDIIRIISARRATRAERHAYEEAP
jgi:uncharacterized DUF497 family protein